MAEPALLGQFLDGAISADVIADNTDTILGRLVAEGFTVTEAQSAYQLVSGCAPRAGRPGHPGQACRRRRPAGGREYGRVLAERDPATSPTSGPCWPRPP